MLRPSENQKRFLLCCIFSIFCVSFMGYCLVLKTVQAQARISMPQDLTPQQNQECERCYRCRGRCQELRGYCAEPCGYEYATCDRLCRQSSTDATQCVRDCSEAMIECTSYCETAKRQCVQDSVCQPYCQN